MEKGAGRKTARIRAWGLAFLTPGCSKRAFWEGKETQNCAARTEAKVLEASGWGGANGKSQPEGLFRGVGSARDQIQGHEDDKQALYH